MDNLFTHTTLFFSLFINIYFFSFFFYQVAHFLQGEDNVDGSQVGPLGITAAELTSEVWDYIFLKGNYPAGCTIEESKLMQCRTEFEFWYPMDLRVSGKDLERNHLTM